MILSCCFFFHYSVKSHIFDCLLTFAKQKFIVNINAFPMDCSVAKDLLSLDKLSITLEQNGGLIYLSRKA